MTKTPEVIIKREIIYYRESLLQAIGADIVTFAFLMFTFWFNYRYLNNTPWVGFLLIVFTLISIAGRNKATKFSNVRDMINYLRRMEREQA